MITVSALMKDDGYIYAITSTERIIIEETE